MMLKAYDFSKLPEIITKYVDARFFSYSEGDIEIHY